MTTSYQDVVRDALQLLNVITEIDTPSAEQGVHGLRILNDMMAHWLEQGLDVEYAPSDSLTEEIDVEKSALRAIKYGLAVELAAYYRDTLTPVIVEQAQTAWDTLRRNRIEIPTTDLTHLPSGSGYGSRYDITNDI
ncbi:MAG: hypothetical protein IPO08_25155 [Xanthomonadales bacterium]|nr:hypothetical protein [Xanthomonadales bacterium]